MKNPTGRLAQLFGQAGQQLYLVGGPVRDRIMGRPSRDLDFTTDARPEKTKTLLRRAGAAGISTVGEEFGTIGAVFNELRVEITTFRSEAYTPGSRKPAVKFGDSLETDLSRRDFTVNAVAQDALSGRITDPYGGVSDIVRRVIRAVGNPDDRFREDPLRVLRAVRFAAQLKFDLHAETASAMRRHAVQLASVSAERIGAELHLIMMSENPDRAVVALLELGLLGLVLPELIPLQKTVQDEHHQHKDVFAHTMRVVANTAPLAELRWAALLHDVAKPDTKSVRARRVRFYGHEDAGSRKARTILCRLRFDNAFAERISHIVLLHMRANGYDSDWTDGAVRRFIREAGSDLSALIALSRADITSYRPRRVELGLARVAELEARCDLLLGEENVRELESPLDGHHLMQMFDRPPGRWIKLIKQHLLDLVLDGKLEPHDMVGAERAARDFAVRISGTVPVVPPEA